MKTRLSHRLRRRFDRWVLAGRPQLVRLQRGDVIVVEVCEQLTPGEEARVRLNVEDCFGYHYEVLVLSGGDRLTVLSDPLAPGR